ncbi:MAG: hypothetical protein Q9208_008182 [Pyrenodesmia sp. 3 TL-2023]
MEPTTTVSSTTFTTTTKVLGPDDDPAALQSDAAPAGYYYYANIDGTTTWLGNKTPTSGVFVTSTAVVTVHPQPLTETTTIITTSQTILSAEDATSTSFTTLSTTSFSTYYHTEEVTLQSAQTSVPSAGLSSHLGSYGWNVTLSNAQKLETSAPVIFPSDVGAQGHGFGKGASTASYELPSPPEYSGDPSAAASSPLPGSEVELTTSAVSPIKPTPPFSNSTQTSAAAATETSSSCGSDTGLFTINFDDLPHFSTESPLSDIPPIFNPYRKLFFNGGYGYVPPPEDPFAPISPPQLAVYNYRNDSISQTSINAGLELHGEIGAGPRVSQNAYWIDAYTTWIGCANGGPSDCTIDFIGYDQFGTNIAQQTLQQPPCLGLANCKLAQVKLTNQFRDLAGLQILAYVNETPVTFYMDDLSLGWSNNTCAAQDERASAS